MIRLTLALDADDYKKYEFRYDPRAVKRLTRDGLKPHGPRSARILVWQVSSSAITAGDYVVSVSGQTSSGDYEGVGDYAFRVTRNSLRSFHLKATTSQVATHKSLGTLGAKCFFASQHY